jgi:hypothetical protein
MKQQLGAIRDTNIAFSLVFRFGAVRVLVAIVPVLRPWLSALIHLIMAS